MLDRKMVINELRARGYVAEEKNVVKNGVNCNGISIRLPKTKTENEKFQIFAGVIYWEEASLRLASTARVSKVTLLTKDSFIFKIGNLHPDDLSRIEDMYRKFLKDNGAI